MRSLAAMLLAAALLLLPAPPARSYTLQYNSAGTIQIKWPTTTITFALSASLNSPPPNVRAGSDVVGAARRALQRWSEVSNLQFNVVASGEERVQQDGVSLITVSGLNGSLFNSPSRGGVARVFSSTSAQGSPPFFPITEADVAINPNALFSTDGTFDTFDLETTLTHEIGHALGLEHSGLCGAVMQPRQARNGTYDLPALRRRVLSDDDRAGIRALYGPLDGLGELRGTVRGAGGAAFFGAHVWAEEVTTGRAIAGNITLPDGSYSIRALPPGQYRVIVEPLTEPVLGSEIPSRNGAYQGLQGPVVDFRTLEAGTASVAPEQVSFFNVALSGLQPAFNPRYVGLNGRLSTSPVQVVPGRTFTLYVGGDNLHSVTNASDIQITSPYFTPNASTLQSFTFQGPSGPVQVFAVDVTASILTAPGDYSVRFARRNAGTGQVEEVAYLSGVITVDLPNGIQPGDPNLSDNTQFFVAQHYRDFLSREPDAGGQGFWSNQIESCATAQCRQVRRINVSAAFFLSIEFQETGYFVYRLYQAAFGDLPGKPVPVRFGQFFADTQQIGRGVVVGIGDWRAQLDANKRAFALDLVTRPGFLARHPATNSPAQFVDALNANAGGVLDAAERQALINQLTGAGNSAQGRADVLRAVAEDADLVRNEFNPAFVLMQYFGYLRRNPDDVGFNGQPDPNFEGFNFWLKKLNDFNGNFVQAEMVRAFLESIEYRRRFGQ